MISSCCQSAASIVLIILRTVLIRLLVLECDVALHNSFCLYKQYDLQILWVLTWKILSCGWCRWWNGHFKDQTQKNCDSVFILAIKSENTKLLEMPVATLDEVDLENFSQYIMYLKRKTKQILEQFVQCFPVPKVKNNWLQFPDLDGVLISMNLFWVKSSAQRSYDFSSDVYYNLYLISAPHLRDIIPFQPILKFQILADHIWQAQTVQPYAIL